MRILASSVYRGMRINIIRIAFGATIDGSRYYYYRFFADDLAPEHEICAKGKQAVLESARAFIDSYLTVEKHLSDKTKGENIC